MAKRECFFSFALVGHLRAVHEEPEPDDADVHKPESLDRANHLLDHGVAQVRRRPQRRLERISDQSGTSKLRLFVANHFAYNRICTCT